MRYIRALILLATLVLPAKSAIANVLNLADYQSFYDLNLNMLPIGDNLYALTARQPKAQGPNCVIDLALKFDAVKADLRNIGTLVGIAASMTDSADESRVIRYLSVVAWEFLEQLKYHRLTLNSIVGSCTEDDAVAKSQEISRNWSDAASLVHSIVKKIGANPP